MSDELEKPELEQPVNEPAGAQEPAVQANAAEPEAAEAAPQAAVAESEAAEAAPQAVVAESEAAEAAPQAVAVEPVSYNEIVHRGAQKPKSQYVGVT